MYKRQVLLPYNFVTMQNPYYAENFNALYETCRERRVAMQTIKAIALRHWSGRPHTTTTWYEPLQQQDDIDLAVWWALSRPGVFLDSVGDVDLLPKVLDAASRMAWLRPCPRAAPVMKATLPSTRPGMFVVPPVPRRL